MCSKVRQTANQQRANLLVEGLILSGFTEKYFTFTSTDRWDPGLMSVHRDNSVLKLNERSL